jgi:dTMP kinase
MVRGQFITLEGTEGAGKSTARQFIQACLEAADIDLVITREPGGTPFAEDIRNILLHHHTEEKLLPKTELLLMFACREQHIKHCIEPALAAGKWVLSDRYVDASYAYQGGGRGVEISAIVALDNMVVGGLYPELTLLLDLPVDVGMARAEQRGVQKDRIEQEKLDFFNRVRDAYLDRARLDPKRIAIIDATQDVDSVQAQIKVILDKFLKNLQRGNQ